MIVVRLSGGLGNQLFQYSAGRRLAIRLGGELVLEDSFYVNPPAKATPRAYELDRFSVRARRTSAMERRRLIAYTHPVCNRVRQFFPLPGRFRFIKQRLANFEKSILDLPASVSSVFMDGYWQSEQYFLDEAAQIRADLEFCDPMSPQDQVVAGRMAAVSAVSLHVRRGDYVSSAATHAMHGVCGRDYYQRAIRAIADSVGNPVFFIFSDDPSWVSENLQIGFHHYHVVHNNAATAFQDLRLMSLCRHHIIANSSFSWWGAWLNSSKEKIVLRPKIWFSGFPNEDLKVCPPKWVAI